MVFRHPIALGMGHFDAQSWRARSRGQLLHRAIDRLALFDSFSQVRNKRRSYCFVTASLLPRYCLVTVFGVFIRHLSD